jgi:hypothetical protein
MRPITVDEILGLDDYDRERDEHRRRIIQMKARRRVPLGREISLVFENRATLIHQLHELMRAEGLTDSEAVSREIEGYNRLLPDEGCLAGTLFIELRDPNRIREEVERFRGLDRGRHLWLDLGGGKKVVAQFRKTEVPEGRSSSIFHVHFPFAEEERELFSDRTREISLMVDHPALREKTVLSSEVREELLRDFES